MPYWNNPWEDAVNVPIEELVKCDSGLNKRCGRMDGTSFILTKEEILNIWRSAGEKLDAYILPQDNGFHCMGIRYGVEVDEYLSPMGDSKKLTMLLSKYNQ